MSVLAIFSGLTSGDQSCPGTPQGPPAPQRAPPAATDQGEGLVGLPQRTPRVGERLVDGGVLKDALEQLIGQVVDLGSSKFCFATQNYQKVIDFFACYTQEQIVGCMVDLISCRVCVVKQKSTKKFIYSENGTIKKNGT